MSSLVPAIVFAWQLARLQVPAPPAPIDELQWTAPPGCPGREALLAGVAQRRGRPLAPGEARIVGRTSTTGRRGYRLELELDVGARRETRVLTASRCAALVDAAALLIVLAIDADTPAAGPPGSLAPAPAASAASPAPTDPPLDPPPPVQQVDAAPLELPPERPRALAPAPAHPRGPGGFVRVQGIGEVGALPGPTGGVGLAGGLLWRRVRVELQATYLAPRAIERPQAELHASLLAGAGLGCARFGRGALELPLCAGFEVGALRGSAAGPGWSASAFRRWSAVSLSFGAAWRAHPRVALWAAVQGLVAVERPVFVLRDPGPEIELFDPGLVSARLALGVELRLREPR